MSEDTTQQLLVTRVDRLISMVEESNARLQNVEARLQNMEARLQNAEARLQNVEARLQNVEDGQAVLREQLGNVDDEVEKLLQNTRPIWESVQSLLENFHTSRVKAEITELRAETASGYRGIDRKIGVLSKNLVDMTAEIRELQDRVEPHPV